MSDLYKGRWKMSYKCSVCGIYDVEHDGGVCEYCAAASDPYAQAARARGRGRAAGPAVSQSRPEPEAVSAGRTPRRKILVSGESSTPAARPAQDMTAPPTPDVPVYRPGQAAVQQSTPASVQAPSAASQAAPAQNTNGALCVGITKNVAASTEQRGFVAKIFDALFRGIPYTADPDVLTFQVFPDYSGTSVTASGTACDQVIVYGKVNAGVVSENNHVRVYGHRDSSRQIIADRIENTASGMIIVPQHNVSAMVVRLAVLAVLVLMATLFAYIGVPGLVLILIAVICLTNLPLVIKLILAILCAFFSGLGAMFRSKNR